MKQRLRGPAWLTCGLVLAVAAAALHGADGPKILNARRTKAALVIDGKLDESAWADAEKAVGFSNSNQPGALSKDQTIGRVLFDDENIYIGIECLESRMDLLKKDLEGMGDGFEHKRGEVIEISLSPHPGGYDYARFLVGANAARLGSFYNVMQMGPMPYEAAVSLGEGRFFVEVAIPLSILHLRGGTKETWGFNLSRKRAIERQASGRSNDGYISSWHNTGRRSKRPGASGRLRIELDSSAYWYDVDLLKSPMETLGASEVRIINRTGKPAELEAVLDLVAADRKKTRRASVSLDAGEEKVVRFAGLFEDWTRRAVLSLRLLDARTKKMLYCGRTRAVDVTPAHEGAVPRYDERAVADGYLLFTKDYSYRILRTYLPSAREVNAPLEIRASPGEYEPCVLGVRTMRLLAGARLEVKGDLVSAEGARISADNIDLGIITETKFWTRESRGQEFRWQPMLIGPELPEELDADRTYTYWITLKVPEAAEAGRYTGQLVFRAAGAPSRTVELKVIIWPIKLLTPPGMCWGYYYDVGRLPKYARTLAYQKLLLKNMAEHGMNNTTIYGGITRSGRLDQHEDPHLPFRRTMEDALAVGAITREIPVMTMGSPVIARRVQAARLKYNWPELLYYAFDEPNSAERIAKARKGLTRIKKAHPSVKTVTAISSRALEALGDLYDVWVVGSGSLGAPVVGEGRSKGKLIWTYDCDNYVTNLPFNRHFAGLFSWKTKVAGNWQWALCDIQTQHRSGRFMPRVFGRSRDELWRLFLARPDEFNFTFNYVLPARQGPIPSVGHVGRREGVDDYKYVYTLKRMIDRAEGADDQGLRAAVGKAKELLDNILDKVAMKPSRRKPLPGGDPTKQRQYRILGDWMPARDIAPEDYNTFRTRVAEQIVILQGK